LVLLFRPFYLPVRIAMANAFVKADIEVEMPWQNQNENENYSRAVICSRANVYFRTKVHLAS
jgi:hypothetical protein